MSQAALLCDLIGLGQPDRMSLDPTTPDWVTIGFSPASRILSPLFHRLRSPLLLALFCLLTMGAACDRDSRFLPRTITKRPDRAGHVLSGLLNPGHFSFKWPSLLNRFFSHQSKSSNNALN